MKTNSDTTPKLYIGLDVHKEQTAVAIADPGAHGECRSYGKIATSIPAIEKLQRRGNLLALGVKPKRVHMASRSHKGYWQTCPAIPIGDGG